MTSHTFSPGYRVGSREGDDSPDVINIGHLAAAVTRQTQKALLYQVLVHGGRKACDNELTILDHILITDIQHM